MKKLLIVSILILFLLPGFSQSSFSEFMNKEIAPALVISAGYVPSTEAIKTSFAYTNFYKRFGAYTSIEASLADAPFFHLIGGTFGIIDELYVWAGLDLFTSHGLFAKGLNGRKEMGVAYAPIPNVMIMPGWSFSIGFTIQAGVRIPLMWLPE